MARSGTSDDYVDIIPTRKHIHTLLDTGASLTQLAKMIGVSRSSLQNWMRTDEGRARAPLASIRKDYAARVAAVSAVDVAARVDPLVDAAPSQRRIRALIAHGYLRNGIARRLGLFDAHVGTLLEQQLVRHSLAAQITSLYRELAFRPVRHGSKWHQGMSRNAIERARALGWPTPLDWDDIDQGILAQDFTPENDDTYIDEIAVTQTLAGDWQPLTAAERLEVIIRARQRGLTDSVVASLIHSNTDTLKRYTAQIDAQQKAAQESPDSDAPIEQGQLSMPKAA